MQMPSVVSRRHARAAPSAPRLGRASCREPDTPHPCRLDQSGQRLRTGRALYRRLGPSGKSVSPHAAFADLGGDGARTQTVSGVQGHASIRGQEALQLLPSKPKVAGLSPAGTISCRNSRVPPPSCRNQMRGSSASAVAAPQRHHYFTSPIRFQLGPSGKSVSPHAAFADLGGDGARTQTVSGVQGHASIRGQEALQLLPSKPKVAGLSPAGTISCRNSRVPPPSCRNQMRGSSASAVAAPQRHHYFTSPIRFQRMKLCTCWPSTVATGGFRMRWFPVSS